MNFDLGIGSVMGSWKGEVELPLEEAELERAKPVECF